LGEWGVKVERCELELGDVLWIARERSSGDGVVLDFVVERKLLDDPVSKDVQLLSIGGRSDLFVVSRMVDFMSRKCVRCIVTSLSDSLSLPGFA